MALELRAAAHVSPCKHLIICALSKIFPNSRLLIEPSRERRMSPMIRHMRGLSHQSAGHRRAACSAALRSFQSLIDSVLRVTRLCGVQAAFWRSIIRCCTPGAARARCMASILRWRLVGSAQARFRASLLRWRTSGLAKARLMALHQRWCLLGSAQARFMATLLRWRNSGSSQVRFVASLLHWPQRPGVLRENVGAAGRDHCCPEGERNPV